MMEIKLNDVLILEGNENYVVISKIEHEGSYYDYLVRITENKDDLLDDVVIVKEIVEDNQIYVEEVIDNELLDILMPIFKVEMEGKGNE